MKVYLATSGSYSDFEVRRVFANREDAEAYELSDDVHEFDVEEGPAETRPWYSIDWFPDEPEGEHEHEGFTGRIFILTNPRPIGSSRRDYDGRPNHTEHGWARGLASRVPTGCLMVGGWDAERVRKVFGELRAQWLNNKALGMVWDAEKLEWTAPETADASLCSCLTPVCGVTDDVPAEYEPDCKRCGLPLTQQARASMKGEQS